MEKPRTASPGDRVRKALAPLRRTDQGPIRNAVLAAVTDLEFELDTLRREHAHLLGQLEWASNRREEQAAKDAIAAHDPAAPAVELPARGFFVYVLWSEAEPLYVGSSGNILARLGSHLSLAERRRLVHRVTVKEYPTRRQMLNAEYALIDHYKPPYNVVGVNGRVIA